MLLIREDGRVVIGRESVSLLTIGAPCRLLNATHLNGAFLLTETLRASKVSLFHFWNDIAGSDDNAAEGDELLDVRRAELPNSVDFP